MVWSHWRDPSHITICGAIVIANPRPSAFDPAGKAECLLRSEHDPEPIVWFFFIEQEYKKLWS